MSTASSPPSAGQVATSVAVSAPPPRVPAGPQTIAAALHDRKHRVDGWTAVRIVAFLHVLAETGSVTKAAAYVQMSTSSAYILRARPGAEAFAEAWESAIGSRHAMLTDIAFDRIRNGVERTRWWKGVKVGIDRVYSDRLLIHQLEATSPERRGRPLPPPPTPEEAAAASRLLDTVGPQCDPGCTGGCPTCTADRAADCTAALQAELAAEEYVWPPEIMAAVEARRAEHAARVAEDEAVVAGIGAMLDAELGRVQVNDD